MAEALPSVFGSLRWRSIGPYRGGRVSAVAGDPTRPLVFYFGSCSGGVWKTEDAGITWRNISDGQFTSASIGDIAVAPSDPNVIYVGSGEAHIRGNIVAGDGVYRSRDGGRTWTHVGLRDTRHIGRVQVHPNDPDTVYVAALGHAFGPNPERGIFRSRDGGETWEKILYRNADTGGIDISLDVTNPRILLAALWQARRYPHKLESGGEGSGLFRSLDGGDNWTEISEFPGLPKGIKGKIGVSISRACPERAYALVESKEAGLYRSDDGGDSWKLISADPSLTSRSFYYNHVFADPQDADRVYVLNVDMWRSTDGGKTFAQIPTPHGDNHGLWIDPRDHDRIIEGNDGGACVSLNGGRSWSSIYNQPTAQFYHVTTDTGYPYRVYGAQQDNWTLSVPSRSDLSGIGQRDIYDVGGAESGYVAVRADDPNIVYAGSSGGGEGGRITRYDRRTRQRRDVTAWPQRTAGLAAEEYTYRFQWTSPIHLSPHDPNVVYSCANRVFRSTDEGSSWDLISPDLTRNDPTRQGPSGGPINVDQTGVEVYCTVFAFAESPVQKGLLWAGSDDGLVHVSRDDGRTWEDVTPPADLLPEWALISIIAPSPHDAGAVYVAATRYKLDDNAPYLLRSSDGGKTWRRIVEGIDPDDFTRVIREDPVRRGLLYCGTESGVYVSFDDGGHWQRMQRNLPVVPIHDMVVHGDDLVLATHGRAFWILDDVTPLRNPPGGEGLTLLPLGDVVRFRPSGNMFGLRDLEISHPTTVLEAPAGDTAYVVRKPVNGEAPEFADRGQNPPNGAVLRYYLPEEPEDELTLTIQAADGTIVRRCSNRTEPGTASLPAAKGSNRFVWNLRSHGVRKLPGGEGGPFGDPEGPLVLPGTYTVELSLGKETSRQTFAVQKDPRIPAGHGELAEQRSLYLEIMAVIDRERGLVQRSREMKSALESWVERSRGRDGEAAVTEGAEAIRERLDAIESQLCRPPAPAGVRPMRFTPRVDDQLVHLLRVTDSADAAPTRQTRELFGQTAARAAELCTALEAAIGEETTVFSALLQKAGIPPV